MNTDEELSSRMRLRYGLHQCFQSNFSRHLLYTCTHTFKVSFSQRGTLALWSSSSGRSIVIADFSTLAGHAPEAFENTRLADEGVVKNLKS